MFKKVCLLLVVMQLCVVSLYAEDYGILRKLGRGTANMLFSIGEVPRQIGKVGKDHGVPGAATYGLFRGITYFMGRSLIGIYEIATCLVPPYTPVVEPEFIFTQEEREKEELE